MNRSQIEQDRIKTNWSELRPFSREGFEEVMESSTNIPLPNKYEINNSCVMKQRHCLKVRNSSFVN